MNFHILTLFPEMVMGGLNTSITDEICNLPGERRERLRLSEIREGCSSSCTYFPV